MAGPDRGALSPLQWRVLQVVATMQPAPLLFGGAALVVGHGSERTTEDLDLMWTPADLLESVPAQVASHLAAAGLRVDEDIVAPGFVRLFVGDGDDECKVDLVAQPRDSIRRRLDVEVGTEQMQVPSATDLLADKLCALLSRAEARDLADAAFLLQRGADWHEAMLGAADRDGGFSPLTLAWVLRSFPIAALERTSGIDDLAALRQTLLDRIVDES